MVQKVNNKNIVEDLAKEYIKNFQTSIFTYTKENFVFDIFFYLFILYALVKSLINLCFK